MPIDLDRLEAAGIAPPSAGRGGAAECFRLLKRGLLLDSTGALRKRILVTSPLAGEGKTFCALSLALSIAMEADTSVLLIDACVARPGVLDMLGLAPREGLMELLQSGGAVLPEAMVRTSVPGLAILPAGYSHPQAAELLASQGMRRLLDDIGGHAPERIVIFDSPPLLLTAEAGELATCAGQVVLVVEADRTPRYALAEAMHRLQGHAGVGIVCNKASP